MLRWLGCSTTFLLSMTSDILPFSVSKRMCTTGVNRVNTHVVHLDGSSLMIKMRHGYEEAGEGMTYSESAKEDDRGTD